MRLIIASVILGLAIASPATAGTKGDIKDFFVKDVPTFFKTDVKDFFVEDIPRTFCHPLAYNARAFGRDVVATQREAGAQFRDNFRPMFEFFGRIKARLHRS